MSRKSRPFANASAAGTKPANEIISLFGNESERFGPAAPAETGKETGKERLQTEPSKAEPNGFSRTDSLKQNPKKRLLYPSLGAAFIFFLLGFGVMASNNWLPHTDALSGKRTGWFGREDVSNNSASSLNPAAPVAAVAVTTGTPQLSKEYIYAGSRMLAVEDAGGAAAANTSPPADLAVWRPSNGTWYILGASGSQQTTAQFGTSGDKPVPGDYDGDGKTDFTVFRPGATAGSPAVWYTQPSDGSAPYNGQFGLTDDKPAPADFDGDKKTDAAFFRESTGEWFVYRSTDHTTQTVSFGTSGDVAMPQDFDSDGKADRTVLRGSAGTFYTLRSSDGAVQSQSGAQTGDEPVPADYDGDGRADYAVRRGNDWIYIQSSDGALQVITWQQGSDRAVQNDYDGDGKVDIAVWRESTGVWYIRQSRDLSTRTVQWGTSGDVPVPAFYRR
jgi:hypothetical protein